MEMTLVPFLAIIALSPVMLRSRLDRPGSQVREAFGEFNAFSAVSIQGLGGLANIVAGAAMVPQARSTATCFLSSRC